MLEKRKNSWSLWSQSGGGKGEELHVWRKQFENCMTEYILNRKLKLDIISSVVI